MKYVIADTHFQHKTFFADWIPVNERMRPFSSVDAWNGHIMEGINNRVKKTDTLYILGDFCFHGLEVEFRRQIRCRDIWFIYGNHDTRSKVKEAFGESRCSDLLERKIFDTPVVMCHYPMFVWNKSHYGSYHLYGHVHNQRTAYLAKLFPEMRALDASPDSHAAHFGTWEPFSEQEIDDILSVKKGHDNIDFYKDFQRENLHNQPIIE